MAHYTFLCIVLYCMVLATKTWPREYNFIQQPNALYHQRADDPFKDQVDLQKREVGLRRNGGRPPHGYVVIPDGTSWNDDKINHSSENNCIENVCNKVEEYPYAAIEEVIVNSPEYRNLLKNFPANVGKDEVDSDANHLCQTNTYKWHAQTIKNYLNITKYIVHFGNYKPLLVMETCRGELIPNITTIPVGHEEKCVQKYVSMPLLATDETGVPEIDEFKIPSCCAYEYEKTYKYVGKFN